MAETVISPFSDTPAGGIPTIKRMREGLGTVDIENDLYSRRGAQGATLLTGMVAPTRDLVSISAGETMTLRAGLFIVVVTDGFINIRINGATGDRLRNNRPIMLISDGYNVGLESAADGSTVVLFYDGRGEH